MTNWSRRALLAFAPFAFGTAQAASMLDLTTFHVSHWEGATYSAGAGAGFEVATTVDTLTISSDGQPIPADPPFGSGPHVQNMPISGNFSLTARVVSTLSAGGGGIFIDGIAKQGQAGGAGVGFSNNGFSGNYFFGSTGGGTGFMNYGGGAIDFRVTFADGTLSFDYSDVDTQVAGLGFVNLYTLTGISGFAPEGLQANPFFDFTANAPEGSTPTGSANFTILDFENSSAVPEPAQWAMLVSGLGLVGGAIRRQRTAFGVRLNG